MDELSLLFLSLSGTINATTLKHLKIIVQAMLCMTGRVTMLGISRWSDEGGSYRTIQRFFQSTIAWETLNLLLIKRQLKSVEHIVLGGDTTTVTKAGYLTHGLGKFFSSIYSRAVKGLSFQVISVLDIQQRKSFPLLVEQVLPPEEEPPQSTEKQAKRGKGRPKGSKNKNRAEVELNSEMKQLQTMLIKVKAFATHVIKPIYFVYDGALGNNNGIQMVKQTGLHLISKLKCNSALYLPWEGKQPLKGRKRKYGNKVDYGNLPNKHLVHQKTEGDVTTKYYQFTAFSKKVHGELNIVVIQKTNNQTQKAARVVLFSTDLNQPWDQIVDYYSLRFQIEFNFRDAKQFWGLEDFMVIKEQKVFNAANLSLFMVNFSSLLLPVSDAVSINDLKSHYRGLKYLKEVFKMLPKNTNEIKNKEMIEQISALGRIHQLKNSA